MKKALKVIGLVLMYLTTFFSTKIMATGTIPRYIGESEGIYISKVLHGTIDVYNIKGKGQVSYDDIIIENTGPFEVQVVLRSVDNDHKSGISLAKSEIQQSSAKKEVYMYLENISSGNGQRYAIAESTKGYNVGTLRSGETMTLAIGGEANTNCSTWNQGDILRTTMKFVFERVEIVEQVAIEGLIEKELESERIEALPDKELEGDLVEDLLGEEQEDNLVEDLLGEEQEDNLVEDLLDKGLEDELVEDLPEKELEDELVEGLPDEEQEDKLTEDLPDESLEDELVEDLQKESLDK